MKGFTVKSIDMTKKIFQKLKIAQIKSDDKGRRLFRLNPYNPLSYIAFIVAAIYIVFRNIYFFLIDTIRDWENPFKWS